MEKQTKLYKETKLFKQYGKNHLNTFMLTLFNKQNTEYFSILDWYFKKFIIPDVSITQGKSH